MTLNLKSAKFTAPMLPPMAATVELSRAARAAAPSANIRLCLALIYYFTLCDTVLKFVPVQIAIVLRYLPEAILYVFALVLLFKKLRVLSFPLFWPLCLCAATMAVSSVLNESSLLAAAGDYRIYFRFVAFTYILWQTNIAPRRIEQLLNGFLGLTIIELVVGGLELIGGRGTQTFFSPAIGWGSGEQIVWHNPIAFAGVWINGTLGDNNRFGFFMATSCVLALTMYFTKGLSRYVWIAFAATLGAVLSFSRHSIVMIIPAVGLLFYLHRHRLAKTFGLRRLVFVVGCLCLLVGATVTLSPSLRDRVSSAFSQESLAGDPTADIRLYMTMELTPRFLRAYPLFGQGPIPPDESVQPGETNTFMGPTLKAAPDLSGWDTFFLSDVVWLMLLGLYGCVGLTAFGFVLWSIVAAARKVVRTDRSLESASVAHACTVMVTLFIMSGFFSQEMIARDAVPIFWAIAGMTLSLAANPRTGGPTVDSQVRLRRVHATSPQVEILKCDRNFAIEAVE